MHDMQKNHCSRDLFALILVDKKMLIFLYECLFHSLNNDNKIAIIIGKNNFNNFNNLRQLRLVDCLSSRVLL